MTDAAAAPNTLRKRTHRQVFVAGVVALTEPGPAAAGIVVMAPDGHTISRRAHYLGTLSRPEAEAQALLAALRLASALELQAPVFHVEDAALIEALQQPRPPWEPIPLLEALREAAAALPGYRLELISPNSNPARAAALEPLLDWLPERTRRAEELRVRPLGGQVYEVESASQPDQVYRVTLPGPGGQPMACECPDFQYRAIPCKHLMAVARQTGDLQRLFASDR